MREELTDAQLKQIHKLHWIAYEYMATLLGIEPIIDKIGWDMHWIAQLSDLMTEIAVKHFGKNEMDIYPYHEED